MSPDGNPELLVIGYGNTLRSDDGVGPRIADAVALLDLEGVATITCDLLTPELADSVARSKEVVFVDAAVDGSPAVQLRPLVPADSSQLMAHAANPGTLLALARDVFGHAPPAWWLTIPVEHMGIGESLSTAAQKGFDVAIEKIKALRLQH
jgi:hydrogenase maturation protease